MSQLQQPPLEEEEEVLSCGTTSAAWLLQTELEMQAQETRVVEGEKQRRRVRRTLTLKTSTAARIQKTTSVVMSLLQHRGQVTHGRLKSLVGNKRSTTIVEVLCAFGILHQKKAKQGKEREEEEEEEEEDDDEEGEEGMTYVLGKEGPKKHESLCETNKLRTQLLETIQDIAHLTKRLLL